MRVYNFKRIQILNINIDDAWEFFSTPVNLARITPPEMGFDITSDVPDDIYPGLIISYIVRPLFKIPVTWITEISQVKKPDYFIDEQRAGPYALWHHQHFFKDLEGKTEMTDLVHYAIPFFILGDLANKVIVRKKIEQIFNHREKILDDLFNK